MFYTIFTKSPSHTANLNTYTASGPTKVERQTGQLPTQFQKLLHGALFYSKDLLKCLFFCIFW